MDEFCATLDRDTAKIVAYNLQKLAKQEARQKVEESQFSKDKKQDSTRQYSTSLPSKTR
jgi:hypothetical protein